uniref:Uncharacterized protein n=1 Tax=Panagrolaimus sp. JU765 TaxID=591449 RepID=A0AC34QHL0_9BILA
MENSPEYGTKKKIKNKVRVDWYDSPNCETSQRFPIRRKAPESDTHGKSSFDDDILAFDSNEEDLPFSDLIRAKSKNSVLDDTHVQAEEKRRLEDELKKGWQTVKKSTALEKLVADKNSTRSQNSSVNSNLNTPTKAVESLVLNTPEEKVLGGSLYTGKTPTKVLLTKLPVFTPPSAPLAHSTPKTGFLRRPMQPNNVEALINQELHDSFDDSFDDWDYADTQKPPQKHTNNVLSKPKNSTTLPSKQIVPETPPHRQEKSDSTILSCETTHVSASFCTPKSTTLRKRVADTNSGISPIFKRIKSMETSFIESPNTRLIKSKSFQPVPTPLDDFEDDFYDDSPFD